MATQDTRHRTAVNHEQVVGKHAREVLQSFVTCAPITTLAAGNSKAAGTLTRLKPPSFLQHTNTSKQ